MALSLDEIREFVRTHMDLDVLDLPDVVLDVFIREGSQLIEQAEPRWPFYEAATTLECVADTQSYPVATALSDDFDQLASIASDDGNLMWVGRDDFTRLTLNGGTGKPTCYTQWAGNIYLWPTPESAHVLDVRYYRKPTDWMAAGAGAEPDLPEILHNTVAIWALSKSYAQQEDPEMAQLYERQFNAELERFRRRITETPHPQPLILNGGGPRSNWGWLRYDWMGTGG